MFSKQLWYSIYLFCTKVLQTLQFSSYTDHTILILHKFLYRYRVFIILLVLLERTARVFNVPRSVLYKLNTEMHKEGSSDTTYSTLRSSTTKLQQSCKIIMLSYTSFCYCIRPQQQFYTYHTARPAEKKESYCICTQIPVRSGS